MLYVSTRNNSDVYTAYRALHEKNTPDGGFYFPFRLPVFSHDELRTFTNQGPGETIAHILNLFFGLGLSAWDVECVIGRAPFRIFPMNFRLLFAEVWHNPGESWDYFLKNLYALLVKKYDEETPDGWVLIAIEIALLFGIYSAMDVSLVTGFDVAVTSGDFSDVISVLLSKDMGLPINHTVCVVNENEDVWDFINRGEFSAGATTFKKTMNYLVPKYLELILFRCFDSKEVMRYINALKNAENYYIDDEKVRLISKDLVATVVSSKRIEQIISSFNRNSQFRLETSSALVYGGLQDHRAHTGLSKETLILVKRKDISA